MCKAMEEMRNEAAKEAMMQRDQETARIMYEKKLSVELIAECVQRPVDVICDWLGIKQPAKA